MQPTVQRSLRLQESLQAAALMPGCGGQSADARDVACARIWVWLDAGWMCGLLRQLEDTQFCFWHFTWSVLWMLLDVQWGRRPESLATSVCATDARQQRRAYMHCWRDDARLCCGCQSGWVNASGSSGAQVVALPLWWMVVGSPVLCELATYL